MMRWHRLAEAAAYPPGIEVEVAEPPQGVEVCEAQTFTDQRRPVVMVVGKELAAVKAGS